MQEITSLRLYYQQKKQFNYNNLDCKSTLCHPNNKLLNFHYKLLPNVLDLNKMLFKFGNIGSPLYSLCSLKDGLPYYLFYECSNTNYLFIVVFNSLDIPLITSQSHRRGGSRTAATSKMEHFVIIVNGWKPLTVTTKNFILDFGAVLDPPLNQLKRTLFNLDFILDLKH